ncbi:NlpC/P60 family protein [Actinoallomurus iriomotensis]|nr:NlpC/P60 family protein [Actinoallomurus iriomotensis]
MTNTADTRGGRDEGATQIILLVAVTCVFALTLLVIRVGWASDLRTRAQTAADAAAIGALTPLRDRAARLAASGVIPDGLSFAWVPGADERARAYAARNGADLVGDVRPSGFAGYTVKAMVTSKNCVLVNGRTDPQAEPCTDASGRSGRGRRAWAAAIARLTLPYCHYLYDTRRPPDDGGAAPVALVCAGTTVWRPGWSAGAANIHRLFKIRLVAAEDPGACLPAQAQPEASGEAEGGIPADYLALYKKAGEQYGIPWNLLAGIGKVETDHGRSPLPGVHSGENEAGAGGPMQFIPSTWAAYGVDGNGDGRKDRYDLADAIPAAARYLKASGAPSRTEAAIFAYNHSRKYVQDVLAWAARYGSGGVAALPVSSSGCSGQIVPTSVPAGAIGQVIAYAMAQRGKPYIWGAEGPNAFDCSGLVVAAYRVIGLPLPRTTFEEWRTGVRVPRGQEQPGDLVFFDSGPGSSPDNPGHVGLVIGNGMMVQAPRTGDVVKVSSYTSRTNLVGFTRPMARRAG